MGSVRDIDVFANNKLFCERACMLMKDVDLLRNVALPKPLVWEVDWHTIDTISAMPNKTKWRGIPFFKDLMTYSKNPVVYYFMIDEVYSASVHSAYQKLEVKKSELRLMNGIKSAEYINLAIFQRNIDQVLIFILEVCKITLIKDYVSIWVILRDKRVLCI